MKNILRRFSANCFLEISIRVILFILFVWVKLQLTFFKTIYKKILFFRKLEHSTPFKRKIHPDEIWLYRNPRTSDYVPISILWPVVFIVPLLVITLNFIINRERNDVSQSIFGFTLTIGLNGVITDTIKLIVGRPRPDFFWRCFPDGEMNIEMECSGDTKSVMDGRKSFPSGHSSCELIL